MNLRKKPKIIKTVCHKYFPKKSFFIVKKTADIKSAVHPGQH
jgi:hypothetical protein